MLRPNTVYIRNRFFGSDYISIVINALQKATEIVLREKTAYYVISKSWYLYSIQSMRSNWTQSMLYNKN